ncbi:spiroplasma plectrovirus-related protein [Spiroplasma phoeniceum P40]|uniref:Spiroplasma plectrovirus-related protein n=1 Tax=Spiroplasma phoeniceum P40 TaxID=1276259 RepID=A0A345DRG7_9MOLU|nr:spiroplasma plectrovirus-related protein [Spiroplasma phoeniceum P40]
MKKSLSLFAIFILSFLGLVIPLITLTAFRPLNGEHYTLKQENNIVLIKVLMKLILLIQCFYAVVFLKIGRKQIILLIQL